MNEENVARHPSVEKLQPPNDGRTAEGGSKLVGALNRSDEAFALETGSFETGAIAMKLILARRAQLGGGDPKPEDFRRLMEVHRTVMAIRS